MKLSCKKSGEVPTCRTFSPATGKNLAQPTCVCVNLNMEY
jgi:hypothetical protein